MQIDIDVFNIKSIDNAIERLNAYKNNLDNAAEIIVDELLNIGYKIAKENVLIMVHPLTGEIASSIIIERHGKASGAIVANSEHAVYVEFGTGVVGEKYSHPMKSEIGFEYAKYDWWYPTIPEDPNPIKWEDDNGQLWAFTSGQPAHPFMYDTATELRTQISRIAREALNVK